MAGRSTVSMIGALGLEAVEPEGAGALFTGFGPGAITDGVVLAKEAAGRFLEATGGGVGGGVCGVGTVGRADAEAE